MLTSATLGAQNLPSAPKMSGYHFQAADTQALQDDNFANPGLLWVDQGETLWGTPSPGNGKSCADCHGDATDSMVGVATRYPKFDSASANLLNLEGRINRCRSEHQDLPPLEYESTKLLALTAYVGFQSRGLPIDVDIEGPAQAFFDAGQRYYYQRRGQMNLACHHCHEQNVGNKLRGDTLSQGQATGYPIYRLEWQTLGSLHRRLRFCNIGVRAEPFAFGAQPYINLELYLAWRAAGLPLETPAVRR
jgi:sulfur-oxidizing protein SoxA